MFRLLCSELPLATMLDGSTRALRLIIVSNMRLTFIPKVQEQTREPS